MFSQILPEYTSSPARGAGIQTLKTRTMKCEFESPISGNKTRSRDKGLFLHLLYSYTLPEEVQIRRRAVSNPGLS
jgi:hypothetical protein